MNVVHEDVKQCVENELQHAVSVFGLHHSWHEKYAVTLEEMRELDEAVKVLWHELEIAFRMTRQNAPDSEIGQEYECIYDAAKDAAIEAIQVAAMCKKEIAEQPQEARWQISSDGYYPYCPICGAQPDKKTMYCAECGAKLGE